LKPAETHPVAFVPACQFVDKCHGGSYEAPAGIHKCQDIEYVGQVCLVLDSNESMLLDTVLCRDVGEGKQGIYPGHGLFPVYGVPKMKQRNALPDIAIDKQVHCCDIRIAVWQKREPASGALLVCGVQVFRELLDNRRCLLCFRACYKRFPVSCITLWALR